jgi:single-stranded DNA-specific DHH superfamily exonuclease
MMRALITHTDLDAAVSSIFANKTFEFDVIKYVGYAKLDATMENLYHKGANQLVTTDINMTEGQMDWCNDHFNSFVYIDHHPTSAQFVGRKAEGLRVVYEHDKSASMLAYELYAKDGYPKQEEYDLAYLANVYDLWQKDNELFPLARRLNDLCNHLKPWGFYARFYNGFDGFTADEEAVLVHLEEERAKILQETERMVLTEGFSEVFLPPNPSVINDISLVYKVPTSFIMYFDDRNAMWKISMRLTDENPRNASIALETVFAEKWQDSINNYGGHAKACGMQFKPHVEPEEIFAIIEDVNNALLAQKETSYAAA